MFLFPVLGMSHAPSFLVLGAVSLLVVLTVLYMGGWRYFTGTVLGIVNFALILFVFFTGSLAALEYIEALLAAPDRRGVHLTWAVILTASTIFTMFYGGLVNDDTNPVGRFLKKLKPPQYR